MADAAEPAQLDLPFLAIEEPAFALDPARRFAEARAVHPWLARCSVGHVVTEHRAMREMLHHDDCMVMGFNEIVEIMGATGTPWGNFIAGSIQVQHGDTHRRLRSALRAAFTPKQADLYRAVMREEIGRLIDDWGPRGAFDFEHFVSYYPISVLCRMIGASTGAIDSLRASLEALGLAMSMDPQYLPELQRGMGVLDAFVRDLAARRRAGERPGPEGDLLDLLLATRDEGAIDEEELVNLMIFLFGGGYDTSKNVLTLILHTLLDKPDIYARCAESLDYCRKVTNETLRFHAPGTATRKVIAAFDYRGVRFHEGSLIMFPWGMSGRDATAVTDPDNFDPDRTGTRHSHFAFGLGAHMCLGQHIARVQIEEGLHAIARRLRHPVLDGAIGWRPFPGVWGIRGLPIRFEYRG